MHICLIRMLQLIERLRSFNNGLQLDIPNLFSINIFQDLNEQSSHFQVLM